MMLVFTVLCDGDSCWNVKLMWSFVCWKLQNKWQW